MAGRESGEPFPELFQIGDWEIGQNEGCIQRGDLVANVRPPAIKVLVYLAERASHLVPVDELIENFWAPRVVGDDAVAVVISDLRKKLCDDTRNPTYIETIPKRGYRIVALIEAVPSPTDSQMATVRDGRKLSTDSRAITVLPFTNLSKDQEMAELAEGVTCDLIAS